VSHFNDKPDLQKSGWRKRLAADQLTHFEGFGQSADDDFAIQLLEQLRLEQARVEGG